VFSMATTACAAKLVSSAICLSVNGRPNFLVKNSDCPEQLFVPNHGHDEQSPNATNFNTCYGQWVMIEVGLIGTIIDDVKNLRSLDDSGDGVDHQRRIPLPASCLLWPTADV
jgi:hypothetical protein